MPSAGIPTKQGLYDPQYEHDACGIGLVAHFKNRKSNQILQDALTVLQNLDHRAAQGSEANSGDGAGIMLQIPHRFLLQQAVSLDFDLPPPEQYGVGMVFLPKDVGPRTSARRQIERILDEFQLKLLGWRNVPTNHDSLGRTALNSEPWMEQFFIQRPADLTDVQQFERRLYVVRKRLEHIVNQLDLPVYFVSLSARTLVYKGMLTTKQLDSYFLDLQDPSVETAFAIVHSRFSTNTFPSWERAHPCRFLIHNGEINTLRGNVNWMLARLPQCESNLFGVPVDSLHPIIDEGGSDSAIFDNVLEFLVLSGRSLPHAAMMMVPEPWSNHQQMSSARRAFYEYHSCLMEPWDGPAAMVMCDGRQIAATLDRNGLRPARYLVTTGDVVVLASETGVLDIPPDQVRVKDRLSPGRMLLIDLEHGRIIPDDEIKEQIAAEYPYREWLDQHLISLSELPDPPHVHQPDHQTMLQRQIAFGYTYEELMKMLLPMVQDENDPTGAMGADVPIAALSRRPQLLYNYFKQLFAQVTNPPIDAIREEIVTATSTTLGPEGNLLRPLPSSCRQIELASPILTNEDFAKLIHLNHEGRTSVTLPITFDIEGGADGMERALEQMFAAADAAIAAGTHVIVLSDRAVNGQKAAIPALLAVSSLHHHLIRNGSRTKTSLVIESAEPREVHHFALLIGYGASAVNPYLALGSLDDLIRSGLLTGVTYQEAATRYVKASTKGLVKVLSKMGISTIQSYHGAQIFEAIGLSPEFVGTYFSRTPTRIGGVGMSDIFEDIKIRHQSAYAARIAGTLPELDAGGKLAWRPGGEEHLYTPHTVHLLQHACRTGDYQLFKQYARKVNEQNEAHVTLRSLFAIEPVQPAIPLSEVEPAEAIVRRFKTGAMSYGALSQEAHESLAIAMNRLGGKSNSGEGGEDPTRYAVDENGDSRMSAIKQIASGRFGVNSHYLIHAEELQIKVAQGAKPGEGGQLPGKKVYPWIAKVRHSTPGVGLISPPPHHDIYSIEDLAELIHDLKCANPLARISVKLVSAVGVGTVAAGVAKGKADVILVSGYDGGTGAAPITSIQHAGLPWELGLAETHQTLVLNGLRNRVVLEVDGKLMTGRDVVVGALLGAEEFGFSTAPLVVLGCVMMRACHLDTCPVGIATQNPELRRHFRGNPAHVENFMRFVAEEIREEMARLGFRTFAEMVGRTDCLRQASTAGKAAKLDLGALLYRPNVDAAQGADASLKAGPPASLDKEMLIPAAASAFHGKTPVYGSFSIRNTDRAVGTMLGSQVTKQFGVDGLREDSICFRFTGSAGQSLAAFMPRGIRFDLTGDANDYLGKGLSGGKIVVCPPADATFVPEETIMIGNVALYGATAGDVFIRGQAGERFAVRNSGATAVVEGVGDHGCEYMTGGTVLVLGPTGRNFAAGMSGGTVFVWDPQERFPSNCNQEMVQLLTLGEEDEVTVKALLVQHINHTNSGLARRLLDGWEAAVEQFIRVMPKEVPAWGK